MSSDRVKFVNGAGHTAMLHRFPIPKPIGRSGGRKRLL